MSGERVYPLPLPDRDTVDERFAHGLALDERFTRGLVLDVAQLLVRHGYPPLRAADLVELQQALFGFLYRGEPS